MRPHMAPWVAFGTLPGVLLILRLCSVIGDAQGNPTPRAWQAIMGTTDEVVGPYSGSARVQYSLRDPEDFLGKHGELLGQHANNIHHIGPEGFQPFNALSKGFWQPARDGSNSWVWSLVIKSPGAVSHILALRDIQLPPGGELVVYSQASAGERRVCGRGCHRLGFLDVPASRAFTTLALPGDVAVMEYIHPEVPLTHLETVPVITIASITQGLGDFLVPLVEGRQSSRRRLQQARGNTEATVGGLPPGTASGSSNGILDVNATFGSLFNMDKIQSRGKNTVAPCTPSIECDNSWQVEAQAVVDIYAIDLTINAVGVCTGTLLNRPKLLAQNGVKSGIGSAQEIFIVTADHCFPNKTEISAFQNWVIIFEYEVPCKTRGSNIIPIQKTIQGVGLLFYDSTADVLLLSVPTAIPHGYPAYFAGYDARMDAVPTSAVGIHHPIGQPKRISYANTSANILTTFPAPTFPAGEIQPTDESHFMVLWSKGATQGGSSGSPLFDIETRRVVGVLSGGFSRCSSKKLGDYYGRLAAAYLVGLDRFLGDPESLGSPDDIKDELKTSPNVRYGDLVTAFRDGAYHKVNNSQLVLLPALTQLYAGETNATIVVYLSSAPDAGETITVTANIVELPGNQVNATDFASLDKPALTFNATNWDKPQLVTVKINRSGWAGDVPGSLLRLVVQFSPQSSSSTAKELDILSVKIIIQPRPASWRDFKPLVVPYIPIKYAAPDISSPSGKAIFQFTPNATEFVTVKVCRIAVSMTTAAGTVSVYMDGRFIATLSHDLYGSPYCIHVPAARLRAGHVYTIVVSDEQDLGAIINMSSIDRMSLKIYDDARFPRPGKTKAVNGSATSPALAPAALPSPIPDGAVEPSGAVSASSVRLG